MSAGFAILCIVAAGIPLGILYVLYGPARGQPLVALPRASMQAIPRPLGLRGSAATYQPEAVFAADQRVMLANASSVARIVPAPRKGPPPVPRRMARGSDAPPILHDQTSPDGNPFVDESATYLGDLS